MRNCLIALLLISALLTSAASAETTITTLVVRNPSPVARPMVPLTCGLPLPDGEVKDEGRLALRVAGESIPAQFTPMIRNAADGSIRWVQVDAVLDLPAAEKDKPATVKADLVQLDARPAPLGPVLARQNEQDIIIATGAMTVMLPRKRFIGLDKAWLAPDGDGAVDPDYQAFNGGAGGPSMTRGADILGSAGVPAKVEIERNGPVACTVLATGTLGPPGDGALDYIVRLTFYRGLPVARVTYTWARMRGPREEWIELSRLGFEVLTGLTPGEGGKLTLQIGGSDQVHTGQLSADGDKAWIAHDEPDRYALGGSMIGNGAGRGVDAMTTGWASVDNGKVGVAAGRRYFWQMAPSDIIIACDSDQKIAPLMSLGLYSGRTKEPVRAYTGAGRTHEIYLALFDAGKRDEVAVRMRDLTEPALLAGSPAYYARATQVFGPATPTDPEAFLAPGLAAAKAIDRQVGLMVDWFNFNRGNVDGVSSYHYRYFGDFPAGRMGSDRHELLWAGNDHDFPHVAFTQWLRTGEPKFFRAFYETSGQLLDVQTLLADADKRYVGATRYSPGQDQVMYRGRPYASSTFSFLHARGMIERALITSDPWAMQVAWTAIERAADWTGSDNQYNEPASVGNQLLALVTAWELSGQQRYLDRAKRVVGFARRFQDRYDGLYFPQDRKLAETSVTCEGMLAYFRATGDREAVDSVRRHVSAMIAGKLLESDYVRASASGFAYPLAFLAAYDSNTDWRKQAIDLLTNITPKQTIGEFTLAYRSVAQALYFLSKRGAHDKALDHPRE